MVTLTEIVNKHKTGSLMTEQLVIDSEIGRNFYVEFITKFLERGTVTKTARVEYNKNENKLTVVLIGTRGNKFFFEIESKDLDINPSKIRSHFVLEGNSGNLSYLPIHEDDNRRNRVSLLDTGRGNGRGYLRTNIERTRTGPLEFNLGISSLSIPIISHNLDMAQENYRVHYTLNYGNREDDAAFTAVTNLNLDLISYLESNNTWGDSFTRMDLVTNKPHSIVYDPLDNTYQLANVKAIYESDLDTIHKMFSKVSRSEPYGSLQLFFDLEKSKIATRVKNSDGFDNQRCVDFTPLYVDKLESQQIATCIDYRTWFRSVKSRAASSHSISNLLQPLDGCKELFGVDKSGRFLYGATFSDDTGKVSAFVTLDAMKDAVTWDEELFKTARRGRKPKKASNPPVVEPVVEEVPAVCLESERYQAWREISDAYYTARNENIKTDLQSVFGALINSGSDITEEDMIEFSRLREI